MKENEDKSTTGFVSLQNENEDHNTSVHKDDDGGGGGGGGGGKWKGKVKQKANPTAGIPMWCPDLHLDQEDRRALIHNKWLSDKHIYAAQILLKKQFAYIGGLQPPTLSQTGQWQVMSSEGIQILHSGNHWLCVSTIGCPGNTIILYDSMNHRKTSQSIVAQISSFINCQGTSYTIQVIKCQKQSGCNDCYLFAIATATALCNGELPSSKIWDQSAMRIHLVKCFESRLMMPFTGKLEPNIMMEDIVRKEVISV